MKREIRIVDVNNIMEKRVESVSTILDYFDEHLYNFIKHINSHLLKNYDPKVKTYTTGYSPDNLSQRLSTSRNTHNVTQDYIQQVLKSFLEKHLLDSGWVLKDFYIRNGYDFVITILISKTGKSTNIIKDTELDLSV